MCLRPPINIQIKIQTHETHFMQYLYYKFNKHHIIKFINIIKLKQIQLTIYLHGSGWTLK